MRTRRSRSSLSLAAATLAAVVVAGCSAGAEQEDLPAAGASDVGLDSADGGGEASAQEDAGVPRPVSPAQAEEAAGAESEEPAGQDSSGTLPEGRMIARDATLAIEVSDIAQGASRVRAVAAATDGYVVQEEVRPGDPEDGVPGYATIVLSVPTAKLDTALTQLGEVGSVTERGMSSIDVTADYVDTTARIETLEASVARVRELMGRAESIADVVALESDLSRREADLDALKAHAESLEGDVSRSSVTVSLTEPAPEDEPEPVDAEGPGGFVQGLRDGWDAFTTAANAALTAAGAALPFAGAAALVVGPFWLVRRRSQAADDDPAPAHLPDN